MITMDGWVLHSAYEDGTWRGVEKCSHDDAGAACVSSEKDAIEHSEEKGMPEYMKPRKIQLRIPEVGEGAENTITLDIPITEEDRLAADHSMAYASDGKPMDDYWLINFVLMPKVKFFLHMLRSKMKWDKGKFREMPGYPTEQKKNLREVTLLDGSKAVALVPGGTFKLHVNRPAEGSWDCEKSPTKKCWYDDQKDPCWDFCIYCGQPQERK